MRDARTEAATRVDWRHDVRVLEPSPPAVNEPPFFADDPVAGGEVIPVDRAGARSWAQLCESEDDPELRPWCVDRWLVRGPLRPLPAGFGVTRRSLHALAEHVLAPARHAANGKIGLRFTYHGFGTPFFGADRQLRVEDGELVDGDRRHRLTTLRAAAAFVGLELPAETAVYAPTTPAAYDEPLVVDTPSARALGDWYGFCASVLEQLRADAGDEGVPERVQLWPEHFDIAIGLGPAGAHANIGGSPGDDNHPEPYVYVSPWDPHPNDPYWNEPFGASLSYQAILEGASALAFFRRGRQLLQV